MKKISIAVLLGLSLGLAAPAEMISNLSANVVSYFSFDNESDLGHDDSGNENNLAAYKALPTYTSAGKLNGATSFDGTSGWKMATGGFTTPSFTIAAFMQFDESCPEWCKMICSGYSLSGSSQNILLQRNTAVYSSTAYIGTYDEAGHVSAIAGTTSLANGTNWYHVTVSFEATSGPDANGVYIGTLKVYGNGILENTKTDAEYAPAASTMYFGRGASGPMTGQMDEIYVFDGALTDREVAVLSGMSIPTNLVARWTFDDPNDRRFDSSMDGHTLTMLGESSLSYAPGKSGDAVHITTNKCEFKVADVLGPTVTIAGFFKADADNDGTDMLFSSDTKSGGLRIYTYQNQIRFMTCYNPTNFTFEPSSIDHVSGGDWQHIAMSFTPGGEADENGNYTGTMKGYVNGVLAVNKTDAIYNPNAELRMSGFSDSYLGMIDEVNVFNTALTDSEIAELAQQGAPASYAEWAEQFGGTNVIGATTDDYDGDGLINLYEYGLGGNPTNALDTGISPQYGIVEQGGTSYLGYVYPQLLGTSGLTYSLETSTNLVSGTWTNAGITVLGTNMVGSMNMVSNYTDTVDSQKFIRLMISTNTP